MNLEQYLLVCFQEELNEVAQETSKCLRFTVNHTAPCYEDSNLQRLRLEVADVHAVSELLREICGVETGFRTPIEMSPDEAARLVDKKNRTIQSFEWARNLGTLQS